MSVLKAMGAEEAGTPPTPGWCLLDRWDVYWGPWVARVCTSVSVGGQRENSSV